MKEMVLRCVKVRFRKLQRLLPPSVEVGVGARVCVCVRMCM